MDRRVFFGIFMLAVLLVFAAGCSENAPEPENNLQGGNSEPEEAAEEESAEQEVPAPIETQLSQEITDILAKSEGISSFEYIYQQSDTAIYTANHYVLGDKMRIEYRSRQDYEGFMYYDIYIDKAEETAYLVCGDKTQCKGIKGKEVDFDEFNMETPIEVIPYIDNGEEIGVANVDGKATIIVNYYNKDGNSEKIWLWTYRGMPLKREITKGDTTLTIFYQSMVVNPADKTSLELPEEIEMV